MYCVLAVFLLLLAALHPSDASCGQAEYVTNGECCPMCGAGFRVFRHCTDFTSTQCTACVGSTFIDAPNGLSQCRPCTECDIGLGLRVERSCTHTSDTVCGPLEGYFCTRTSKAGCISAVKHTTCRPGQYIRHNGTANSDTVCESCPPNSYSDGSASCTSHTDCESGKLIILKRGTSLSDTVCGEKPVGGLIAYIVVGVAVPVLAAAAIIIVVKYRSFILQKLCPSYSKKTDRAQNQETPEEANLQPV